MRDCYYLLREPGPDVTIGGTTVSSGHPQMPATWTVREIYRGHVVLYHVEADDGHVLHVYRLNSHPSRSEALYAVACEDAYLDTLAAHVSDAVPMAPARDVWDAATSGNATARLLLRSHPHWRIDGTVRVSTDDLGDPVTASVTDHPWRLLRGEGGQLPDPAVTPLPWLLDRDGQITAVVADAYAQVTTLHYPTLIHDVAGWRDYQSFEVAA